MAKKTSAAKKDKKSVKKKTGNSTSPKKDKVRKSQSNTKLIDRTEANNILRAGYPSDAKLLRFPLGEQLATIPDVNDRYGDKKDKNGVMKPGHISNVVKGINILLSKDRHEIVKRWTKPNNSTNQDLITFTQVMDSIFGRNTGAWKAIWNECIK